MYLSVLKWAFELAGIPVAPLFVDLLAEVARRRADPQELPGLAAQIPDSPLIRWLHSSGRPLAGDLRVVAGDMDGDSVASWVKTLLADAFFWTDNDLAVQTRSMYGGSPRSAATFLLDEGGRVNHFNYFANEHSAGAIVNALVQDHPPAFAAIGRSVERQVRDGHTCRASGGDWFAEGEAARRDPGARNLRQPPRGG